MKLRYPHENISDIVKPFILFVVAFLPRVIDLGTILTIDEPGWIRRSSFFIQAITHLELQDTLITAHPGVTTMWASGLSLWMKNALGNGGTRGLLFAAKFPIALITSLGVVLAYYLLKRIFNEEIALLAALFIALDPFLIAHSRIIHLDALLTIFMLLSILSFISFLNHRQNSYYLYVSGIFAGLAFLTKLPGFLLVPFILFTLRSRYVANIKEKQLKLFLIWCGIGVFIYFAIWPALWVSPLSTTNALIQNTLLVVTTPHEGSNFFMGKIRPDPGFLFYPVVLLLRSTPIILLFFIISLFYLTKTPKLQKESQIILLSLGLFFILVLSLSAKKGDRYLLPVFPLVDILAATGVYQMTEELVKNKRHVISIFIICILLQAFSSISLHPYYLSYYNPVIGPSNAPDILIVGWGEGLENAAEYLNQKSTEDTVVAAYYPQVFRVFFKGNLVDMSDVPLLYPKIDYYVFYINQIQRETYFESFVTEYTEGHPEHIVKINGIPYVRIYKGR